LVRSNRCSSKPSTSSWLKAPSGLVTIPIDALVSGAALFDATAGRLSKELAVRERSNGSRRAASRYTEASSGH
jgi:hypothetical protein